MMRYLPARHYLSFGIAAFALAAFSGWLGLGWLPAFIPCVMFLVSASILVYLAYRPAIEIQARGALAGRVAFCASGGWSRSLYSRRKDCPSEDQDFGGCDMLTQSKEPKWKSLTKLGL